MCSLLLIIYNWGIGSSLSMPMYSVIIKQVIILSKKNNNKTSHNQMFGYWNYEAPYSGLLRIPKKLLQILSRRSSSGVFSFKDWLEVVYVS